MKIQNFNPEYPSGTGGTGSLVSGSALVNAYRDTVAAMTNRSGTARFAGDVVIVDTTADLSFTISASCNTLLPVGVLLEDTPIGSNGRVRFGGLAESVAVGSNVAAVPGQFLYHSSTPTRANVMFGTAPSAGAFGYVVAAGSNTLPKALIFPTYDGAGGAASLSYGSNATRVREVSTAGSAVEVARHDHAHDGIGTITASSSNTMQRGTWNLRPGAGIALSLSDTDGDGEFDTTTIVNTGSGGGGGSSSVSWTANLNLDGSSFTGWTAASGTWSSDGTTINQTDTTATHRRAKYDAAEYPIGFGYILECEANIQTTGSGAIRGGLLVADNGSSGLVIYLEKSNQLIVEVDASVVAASYSTTINSSTWYKIRLVHSSQVGSVYIDGTLLGSFYTALSSKKMWPGLYTYAASVKFRNFKLWTLSGGAP